MQPASKPVKIAQPARVERILKRICAENLQVLLRREDQKKVAVRGNAEAIRDGDNPPALLISDISDKGLRHLKNPGVVRVEFAGMSNKVVFRTKVIKQEFDTVYVVKPTSLFSIERRANARHAVNERLLSFVQLERWQPRMTEVTSPPMLSPYLDISNWLGLGDISEGGFCAVTRFPSVLASISQGDVDQNAKLILPMQPPIDSPVEVRWVRRIQEKMDLEGTTRHKQFFRIGLQFSEFSDELMVGVKQYIHQVSMVDAI